MKSKMCKTAIRVLFLIAIVVGFSIAAYAASPSDIVGTWGYMVLEHGNDSSWGSTAGKSIFQPNGTGSDTYCSNDGGTPHCKTKTFTYSATPNTDGSLTITQIYPDGTQTLKSVLSDDKKMAISDGTTGPTVQMINIATRMDTTKTCGNADLKGEYYVIGYEYNASGGTLGYRRAWSGILQADGSGNYSKISTLNGDGTVKNMTQSGTYTVNGDCSIAWKGGIAGKGYLNGEGKLAVAANPASANDFVNYFLMKKGDKTYSISDVPGTFAYVAFGDEVNGSSFNAEFGSCTNNGSAESTFSGKFQANGNIAYYISGGHIMSGKTDGSINFTIPYTGAAGNNGNTFIENARSFRPDEITDREIMIGVRCSDCINVEERKIPMASFFMKPDGHYGTNIYLYVPPDKIISVKPNNNNETLASLNMSQTKLVYTENIEGESYEMFVYNINSKTTSKITSATTKEDSAYFNNEGKILFIDYASSVLKKMNPDGTGIIPVAYPEASYIFDVFWLSPDYEKIIIREEQDTGSDEYQRLVCLNSDGTGRKVVKEGFGDWNALFWKQDSRTFLYYYHEDDVPKYNIIAIDDDCNSTVKNISSSDMGKDENIGFYTKSNNLLSLTYRELYDGKTGNLISDVSSVVPDLPNSMFGLDFTGEIYFANLDKTNLRRFVELPTQLTAKAISSSKIVLGWVDNAYNAGFKVERKLGSCGSTNSWSQRVDIKPSNTTSYTDTGSPNTTYSYRVRAYNLGGNSVYSNCASATTGVSGTPNSPTNLKATFISANQIRLTWSHNCTNVTSFKIYKKAGSDSWIAITKEGCAVSHIDTGNTTSMTYSYYIQVCNSSGCSPSTNTATVPYSPATLNTTSEPDQFSFYKINLTWHDNSNNETGFEIDRKTGVCSSSDPWKLLTTTPPNITAYAAYTDMGISSGATYSYKVRAYKRSLARPYANGYSLFTNCSTP